MKARRLKRVVSQEKRELRSAPRRWLAEVDFTLRQLFDRQLFRVRPVDQLRLLTLKVWTDKYNVGLAYILGILIPYYLEQAKKLRRRTNPDGIGIRIPTLVGKNSERLLKEAIEREYPDGDNKQMQQWERINEIYARRNEDEFTSGRHKTILDYPSVQKYVAAYRKRVRKKQRDFLSSSRSKENRRRHYRGNPFIGW